MSNVESPALIPPSTPAHRKIIDTRRQALTAELQRIFENRPCEFVWEVGCGHGHFLTAYADAHPESVCIGVDIASDRVERAQRKRDRRGLENLHFLRADARLFLDVLPPDLQLSEVFVLFPDPWPKLRHHKHRVMQPEFLSWVARRMKPSGRLCFRTDFLPYFEDTVRVFRAHSDWTLVDEPWPFEFETVFQSRAKTYASLIARSKARS